MLSLMEHIFLVFQLRRGRVCWGRFLEEVYVWPVNIAGEVAGEVVAGKTGCEDQPGSLENAPSRAPVASGARGARPAGAKRAQRARRARTERSEVSYAWARSARAEGAERPRSGRGAPAARVKQNTD